MSSPGNLGKEDLNSATPEISGASVNITMEFSSRNPEQKEDVKPQQLSPVEVPYSVFTKPPKLFISLLASFAGMFSTLCSYIYYPALIPISRDLSVSVSLINLTITSCLIIAAVAPAFMDDMADQGGPRPVYVASGIKLCIFSDWPIFLGMLYRAMLRSRGPCAL